jgi:hypothetical protein
MLQLQVASGRGSLLLSLVGLKTSIDWTRPNTLGQGNALHPDYRLKSSLIQKSHRHTQNNVPTSSWVFLGPVDIKKLSLTVVSRPILEMLLAQREYMFTSVILSSLLLPIFGVSQTTALKEVKSHVIRGVKTQKGRLPQNLKDLCKAAHLLSSRSD